MATDSYTTSRDVIVVSLVVGGLPLFAGVVRSDAGVVPRNLRHVSVALDQGVFQIHRRKDV